MRHDRTMLFSRFRVKPVRKRHAGFIRKPGRQERQPVTNSLAEKPCANRSAVRSL